jgi:hypothetical protein
MRWARPRPEALPGRFLGPACLLGPPLARARPTRASTPTRLAGPAVWITRYLPVRCTLDERGPGSGLGHASWSEPNHSTGSSGPGPAPCPARLLPCSDADPAGLQPVRSRHRHGPPSARSAIGTVRHRHGPAVGIGPPSRSVRVRHRLGPTGALRAPACKRPRLAGWLTRADPTRRTVARARPCS